MRTDGVHCRESTGTRPVVLKVVPATGAAFSGFTLDQFAMPLFSHTQYWYVVGMLVLVSMCDIESIGGGQSSIFYFIGCEIISTYVMPRTKLAPLEDLRNLSPEGSA